MSRDDVQERVLSLSASGMCCSSILVSMALRDTGQDHPEMVRHVSSLCGGLWVGITCGALTGGVLALSILHGRDATDPADVKAFVTWFCERYGATDCGDLVGQESLERAVRCPTIVAAAYEHVLSMLASASG